MGPGYRRVEGQHIGPSAEKNKNPSIRQDRTHEPETFLFSMKKRHDPFSISINLSKDLTRRI